MLCRSIFRVSLKHILGLFRVLSPRWHSAIPLARFSNLLLPFFFLSTLSVLKLLSCSLLCQHHISIVIFWGWVSSSRSSLSPGQWRRKNWNLCSMGGCLVASHRKFRDATHRRTFFKLSIQVGGDALPYENLHLLSFPPSCPLLAGIYQGHSWWNVPCSEGRHHRMVGQTRSAVWVPLRLPEWRLRADMAHWHGSAR